MVDCSSTQYVVYEKSKCIEEVLLCCDKVCMIAQKEHGQSSKPSEEYFNSPYARINVQSWKKAM